MFWCNNKFWIKSLLLSTNKNIIVASMLFPQAYEHAKVWMNINILPPLDSVKLESNIFKGLSDQLMDVNTHLSLRSVLFSIISWWIITVCFNIRCVSSVLRELEITPSGAAGDQLMILWRIVSRNKPVHFVTLFTHSDAKILTEAASSK